MGVDVERFRADLRGWSRVALDTSILIYHLADAAPYSELTELALASVAHGRPAGILSTISVTELLVEPFKGQAEDLEAAESFLTALPNTRLTAPDYPIAREAARLRAHYGLRTPDALLVATALLGQADAFLTNDTRLRKLKGEAISIVFLDDYIS